MISFFDPILDVIKNLCGNDLKRAVLTLFFTQVKDMWVDAAQRRLQLKQIASATRSLETIPPAEYFYDQCVEVAPCEQVIYE